MQLKNRNGKQQNGKQQKKLKLKSGNNNNLRGKHKANTTKAQLTIYKKSTNILQHFRSLEAGGCRR